MARWRTDIYYSGFTTVYIEAAEEHEAILKGRQEAVQRLQQAIIFDPDGCMQQLLDTLEPWKACDAAERDDLSGG